MRRCWRPRRTWPIPGRRMSSVPRNPDGRRGVLRMSRPAPRLMNARGCATTWTANAGRRPRWLLMLNSRLLSVASAKLPQPSLIPPADRTDPQCRLHREGRRRAGHTGRAVGQSRATEIIPRPFMCCVMTDGSTPQPRRRGFYHADDPSTGERRPPWTASWPAATRSSLSPGAINMTLEDRCRRPAPTCDSRPAPSPRVTASSRPWVLGWALLRAFR